jgi:membrane protein DedA with SNARE-associated domain
MAVADWVFSIVDRLGPAGIGILIMLENLIPPVPSEVILPLAGFRARTGAFDVVPAWLCATAGSVAGALVLYALGRWLGYQRLHRLAGRRWFILVSQPDLERGQRLFERHGGKVVLFGRMVPFIRSVVSIPAGILGMPIGRFTLLTALGSGIWNGLFITLGWILGPEFARAAEWVGPASYAVLGLVVVGLGWLVVRRIRGARGDPAPRPTA